MHISLIAADCMSIILEMICLDDVISLYATNQCQLQILVRRSVTNLKFDSTRCKGPRNNLIRSLTNICRFQITKNVEMNATEFSLLRTLNPLELDICSDFMDKTIFENLAMEPKDMSKREIRNTVANFNPNGFPNLGFLTPRLRTLRLFGDNCALLYQKSNFPKPYRLFLAQHQLTHEIFWPPTLTAFEVDFSEDYFNEWLGVLPATLHWLSLRHKNGPDNARCPPENSPLAAIFLKFKLLHSLELEPFHFAVTDPVAPLPSSLTSLKFLNCYSFPVTLFTRFNLQNSHLCHITIKQRIPVRAPAVSAEPFGCDLNALLPPSLTTANIISGCLVRKPEYPTLFLSYPRSLTHLKLKINRPSGQVFVALASLTSLTSLDVDVHQQCRPSYAQSSNDSLLNHTSSPTSTIFDARSLPGSLRKLHMRLSIEPSAFFVSSLPPNLTHLYVNLFDYDNLKAFGARCIDCHLHLTTLVCTRMRFVRDIIQRNFPQFWSPVLDLGGLITSMDAFAAAYKLHLSFCDRPIPSEVTSVVQVSPIGHTSHFVHNLGINTFMHSIDEATHLESLSIMDAGEEWEVPLELPGSLLSLELGNTPITGRYFSFPHLVRFASSYSLRNPTLSIELSTENLRFWDTPNWILTPTQFDTLQVPKLELLRCKILVADYNAIDYLTNFLPQQTSLLDNIGIVIAPTGALIRDNDNYCMKDVTWRSLCEETISTLKRYLNHTIWLLAPKLSDGSYLASSQSIQRMSDSITLHEASIERIVSLPKSATSASLQFGMPFHISSNLRSLLSRKDNLWPHLESLYEEGMIYLLGFDEPDPPLEPLFGPNLVHLELLGVINAASVICQLPPSVRYLRLESTRSIQQARFRHDYGLISLVLQTDDLPEIISEFMLALPRSVRHVALSFCPSPLGCRPCRPFVATAPRLLQLETLILGDWTFENTILMTNIIDPTSLRRIEVLPKEIIHGSRWATISSDYHLSPNMLLVKLVSKFDVSDFKSLSDQVGDKEALELDAEARHFFEAVPSMASLLDVSTRKTTIPSTTMHVYVSAPHIDALLDQRFEGMLRTASGPQDASPKRS